MCYALTHITPSICSICTFQNNFTSSVSYMGIICQLDGTGTDSFRVTYCWLVQEPRDKNTFNKTENPDVAQVHRPFP